MSLFEKIPINQIQIGERLREDLGDIASLAEEIKAVGLLNPVTVSSDLRLLAGYRRLEACRSLGWEKIPAIVLPEGEP